MILPNFDNLIVPDSVLDFPSMITQPEKKLLYWLASEYFEGVGIIVDAGIFLGASTNAFSTGLEINQRAANTYDKTIRSFDIAIWVDSMNRYLESEKVREVFQGETMSTGKSFEPILRRSLDRHSSKIELIVGDIIETAHSNDPVEIAFFDCLKTNKRDLAVFKAFVPHYIPNRTIILQQDYFHESAAYNKIRQENFSEYFEYVGQVSTTAVFRYVKKIPPAEIEADPVSMLSIHQKVDCLSRAANRAKSNKTKILTKLSIVEFLIDEDAKCLAVEFLKSIEQEMSGLSLDEITRRPERIVSGFKTRLGHL